VSYCRNLLWQRTIIWKKIPRGGVASEQLSEPSVIPGERAFSDNIDKDWIAGQARKDNNSDLAIPTPDTSVIPSQRAFSLLNELSPLSLPDGNGLQSVIVGTDGGDIDLVTQGGPSSSATFSSTSANAYPLQVIAKFPTGATITDKKVEVILPMSLLWSTTGTGVVQLTDNLIGGNAGITNSTPWTGYGTTIQRGRVYSVKGTAQGSEVSALTLNLAFARNGAVWNQTLSDDSNKLKVIVSWKDNGTSQAEEVFLDSITLVNRNSELYWYGPPNNRNVLAGSSYTTSLNPAGFGGYFNSSEIGLNIAYTPASTNTAPAALPTITMANTNGWILSGGTGGNYLLKNYTPSTFPMINYLPLIVNLENEGISIEGTPQAGLRPGDKVTITTSKITVDAYDGISLETEGGISWTYTIIDDSEAVSITNPANWTRFVSRGSSAENLYSFSILNNGGDSKEKELTLNFSNAIGTVGVSPSLMYLPCQNGYEVTVIQYKLVGDSEFKTLNGSWTGDTSNKIRLTIEDFDLLTDTDYLKEIKYIIGSIPAFTSFSESGQLYGKWLNDSITTSTISATLHNTDGSLPDYTYASIGNTLDKNTAPVSGSYLGSQAVNAGSSLDFSFDYNINSGNLFMRKSGSISKPVFYIRNESGGTLDIDSIKITQLNGNINITEQCTITDMGIFSGAYVYKVDTSTVTSNGGKDATISSAPYEYDSSGNIVFDPTYSMRISYKINTVSSTLGGTYNYQNMLLLANEDATTVLSAGTAATKTNGTFGLNGVDTQPLIVSAWASTYTINPKLDAIVGSDGKQSNESEGAYANGVTLKADDTTDVNIRTSLINPSGTTVNGMDVLIPIPKKDESWGALMKGSKSTFDFDMVLKEAIANPDPSTFTIKYGTIAPTDNATFLQAASWETYNSLHAEDYNCIRIIGTNIAYNDVGADAAEKLANNTHPFVMTLEVPYDEDVPDGSLDSWASYYFEDLTISGTGVGSGVYQKWQQGSTISVTTAFGQLGGTIWLDTSLDGSYDATKETKLDPKDNWEVFAYLTSKFDTTSFVADPATYVADVNDKSKVSTYILEGSATSDSDGNYLMKLLNRGLGYTLVAVNQDTSSFRYTTTGSSASLPNMAFSEISLTDTTGLEPVTTYPAATLSGSIPGHHIFDPAKNPDSIGLYDIGLLPIPAYSYAVHYDSAGGTPFIILDQTAIWTDNNLLPTVTPERTGYTFARWDVTSGGAGTDVKNTHIYGSIASDDTNGTAIMLTARWRLNNYSVTYHLGGNSVTNPNDGKTSYTIEDANYTLCAPSRIGYTFGGWYTDAGLSNAATTPAITKGSTTGNLDFYAKWNIKKYSVTFTAGTGGSLSGQTAFTGIDHGTLWSAVGGTGITVPTPVPADSHYSFDKWTAALPSGTFSITGDSTYTASFKLDSHTLTYHGNGHTSGEAPSVVTRTHGGQAVIGDANTLSRNGYTFLGWAESAEAASATYVGGESLSLTDNMTLYAVWKQNEVVVEPPKEPPVVNDSTPEPITKTEVVEEPIEPESVNPAAQISPKEAMIAAAGAAGIPLLPGGIPLVAPNGIASWALLDLLLAIADVVFAIFYIIKASRRRKNEESDLYYEHDRDEEKSVKPLWLATSIILAVISVIIFVLTQDMSLPMVLADVWTIVLALIFAAELIASKLAFPRKDENEKDSSAMAY
jgi:uncharacterized repeat protein (TIGR02543 family)